MSEINKDMEVVCLSSIKMKIAGEISFVSALAKVIRAPHTSPEYKWFKI